MPPLSFAALCQWLHPIQRALAACGYPVWFLGGSAARAIIDGATEQIRDVDVYLPARRPPACEDELQEAARPLLLGGHFVVLSPPRPKRRALRHRAGALGGVRTIGWGLHLRPRAGGGPILSLAVLHREDELDHNGLFDIDTVALRVESGREPGAALHQAGRRDPEQGYAAWQARRPTLIHWEEYRRGYPRHALRAARTWASVGRDLLTPEEVARLRSERPALRACDDHRELWRELAKLLGAPGWRAALVMASQTGALEEWPALAPLSAALGRLTTEAGPDEGPPTGPQVLARARWLLGERPGGAALVARVAEVLPSVYPSEASR